MSVPDQDEINRTVMGMRMDKALSYREIAKETGLSLAAISKILKGIPKPFLGKEQPRGEKNDGTEQKTETVRGLISDVHISKLFALAVDEGFSDPDEWVDKMLLPWYRLKRDFEWKLGSRLDPKQFGGYIELCILDALELKDLKERINRIASHPQPTEQQPTTSALALAGAKT